MGCKNRNVVPKFVDLCLIHESVKRCKFKKIVSFRQVKQVRNSLKIISPLLSRFGLHPVFKESGDKGSGYRMSKKGRKEPRRILYMITLNAIQNNPVILEIYKERTSKGMNNMAAIGLCMHKMLRMCYLSKCFFTFTRFVANNMVLVFIQKK